MILLSSPSSTMMTGNLPRVAVVTGANKGIGYFIALQLGLSGLFSHVILGCRNAVLGQEAAASIQAQLPPAVAVQSLPLVVGDPASHTAFCRALEDAFGKADVLVNNAGMAFKAADPTPFAQQCQPTLDVNFRGTLDFTLQMIPLLQRGDDPRIVNVASMSGRLGQLAPALQEQFASPTLTLDQLHGLVDQFEADVLAGTHREHGWGNSNYGLSKLALIAATRVLAREHPRIAINCCCPGYCDTDMSSHRGTRHPADGARNAVIPATMVDPPTGAFFRDYAVAEW